MKAVTIDQLGMKDHVRWAEDQESYDIALVSESHLVAPHPEILGTSIIYPSKLEELLELQKRNQHWAIFPALYNFPLFGKRFFSYRLFPSIYWEERGEDEEKEEESSENLIEAVIRAQSPNGHIDSLFEKDKTAILKLLESIQWINQLLKQISARKMQYQKG